MKLVAHFVVKYYLDVSCEFYLTAKGKNFSFFFLHMLKSYGFLSSIHINIQSSASIYWLFKTHWWSLLKKASFMRVYFLLTTATGLTWLLIDESGSCS